MMAVLIAVLGLAIAMPATSVASGETVATTFTMKPRKGVFFKQAYRPANWRVVTTVSTLDPQILPMKKAVINLPSRAQMTFNPRTAVCPDNQIGPPPVSVSIPVDEAVARCPRAVIGNGAATFVLAGNNASPAASRDGFIVLFNGGRENGLPKLKVYAYSYDTTVGVYTESVLTNTGRLEFNIPVLTADSAVSKLDLSIPGRNQQFYLPLFDQTVNLPGGRDGNYVQARCFGQFWRYSGVFDLGTRDNGGNPISPTTVVSDQGSESCRGARGRARLTLARAAGPRVLPRRGSRVFRVRVWNGGTAAARGVRIRTNGRWVRFTNRRVANIPAGRSRVYRIRVGLQRRAPRGRSTVVRFGANAFQSRPRFAAVRVRIR
jgi:hypothetical protein